MKSYHITQEQAGELWVEYPAGETLESSLQAFANAVLDRVLGEPVAYLVDGRIEQGLFFDKLSAETMADANCGVVKSLYAPKGQS